MDDIDKRITLAEKLILNSGSFLMSKFRESHQNFTLSGHDIKMKTDAESNEMIVNAIAKEFSEDTIISEESELIQAKSKYNWHIDPLDGTNNFALGIPYFAVSIAITDENEPLASLIYLPAKNELFKAKKGFGAFRNDEKISYNSDELALKKSVVSFIRGHKTVLDQDLKQNVDKVEHFFDKNSRRVLKFWAPVVDWTLISTGKIDLLISIEDELPEEYAGSLLFTEAGGKIHFLKKKNWLVCGNEKVVEEVLNNTTL